MGIGDAGTGSAGDGPPAGKSSKSGKASKSGASGKAGTVAKVAKTGAAGGSGVVSSAQAAGSGTRETARTLPVKRRVRGGVLAASEGRPDGSVTVPADVPAPSAETRTATAAGTRAETPAEPRAGTAADGTEGLPGVPRPGKAGQSRTPAGSGVPAAPDASGAPSEPEAPRALLAPGMKDAAPGRAATPSRKGPGRPDRPGGTAETAAAHVLGAEESPAADGLFGGRFGRWMLPAAAHALTLAGQLAQAAADAGADAGELKYRADLLRDVLAGRLADPGQLPPSGLGRLMNRCVAVVVAEPDPQPDDTAATLRRHQDALAAAWTAAVRQADPDAVVAGYPGEVVALLTVPADAAHRGAVALVAHDVAARVRSACARIPRGFTTGISRPVRGIAALPGAYEQARRAVDAGRRLQGPGAVTDFDRLGVFRLLSLIPAHGELERFAAEVLGTLAEPEDAEASDLRHTLQVLLETNLNVAETSRRLYVHYNTLRYRIGKLERLVGPFTQDSRLRLDLLIALEIVHLADTAPPPS
ncbi:helix-turn-helix domain-containing protein [Yinghuangia soli]|uniref:Helix-turn-helix domain-containing protein n=1 Tax=Yinghuangia soli TaxID=2908204 RepID=A0AA41TZT3_9ACTN|nr:helix-turn-helix domain-containing protein [Yinghuangia soli]MCF2529138.1 helix-turn-helix domain-containing protein [Yinghuangia soli]